MGYEVCGMAQIVFEHKQPLCDAMWRSPAQAGVMRQSLRHTAQTLQALGAELLRGPLG